jgi:hypothetical protein
MKPLKQINCYIKIRTNILTTKEKVEIVVGIPMGTNCAPLLADLFLCSYESEFLQKLVQDKKIHEARAFNFTYRYIDDVLFINNSRFAEILPLIYPLELKVRETTHTAKKYVEL